MTKETVQIRPFQSADQQATQQLILAGLAEHWGELDHNLNPDLHNISQSYRGETFLVAEHRGIIIGCGALITENREAGYGRIVRMSVKKENRRQKIGQQLLHQLESIAQHRDFKKIVLETTTTWSDVITFYLANGYQISGYHNGDTHFEKLI